MQRHRHAGHRADLLGPLAGAIHYDLGLDVAVIGPDAAGTAIADNDAGDTNPLADDDTALPGATGERRSEVDGVRPAVTGQPDRPGQVGGVEQRVPGRGLGRADHFTVDVVSLRGRR